MGTLTHLPKSKGFQVGAVSQLTSVVPFEFCYEEKYFQDGLSFFISLPGPGGFPFLLSALHWVREDGGGHFLEREVFSFQSEEDAEEVSEARP